MSVWLPASPACRLVVRFVKLQVRVNGGKGSRICTKCCLLDVDPRKQVGKDLIFKF
jgi:hypothetical protein